MHSDAGVCVQLLKLNLISNLVLSVLQEDNEQRRQDAYETQIQEIISAAIECEHRKVLLSKSQEFKAEKKRLGKIIEDKRLKMSKQTNQLLVQFLKL